MRRDDKNRELSDEEKERLKEVVDDINRDIELPPYNNRSSKGYSREYKKFKDEEDNSNSLNKYEKFCYKSASILSLKADESARDKLDPAIKLLQWEITPGMVLSATVAAGVISVFGWFLTLILSFLTPIIPLSLVAISITAPLGVTLYIYYLPILAAKNKVIRSSEEIILSILYMVIYMRSSPNLEGAIRFAALNLQGPISNDLKGVLWNVESGKFNTIDNSLKNYTERWKNYNEDYLESLNLIRAALNEPNKDRQNRLLKDAIDNILEGTHEKMKHYAQNLETPVMIINAMGALLPVLGMIMLPLVSAFLGGLIQPIHLIILFNIMLPCFLWVFMQKTLSSRPPSASSQSLTTGNLPPKGKIRKEVLGKKIDIPSWIIGLVIFLIISMYGIWGYITFPAFAPVNDIQASSVPSIFVSDGSADSFTMLMRSLSITLGLGLGIGISKILGNSARKRAEDEIKEIEQQFPTALFELGNKISGGTPIELALQETANSTDDLRISNLFRKTSDNIRNLGMTFEDAVFDDKYGSLQYYPSKTIETVMRAIQSSSEKGTRMVSESMLTISRYLKNIHQTQEQLNDLMDDTTTTIQMLAYMLAPIISGVAVGMSQTIINSLFALGQTFSNAQSDLPTQGPGIGIGGGGQGPGLLTGLDSAIAPEILQFVVGIYLIQLLYILGVFYTKITKGVDKTYKNLFIGKIMVSGTLFYAMTLLIITVVFGGLMTGVAEGL